MKAFFSAVSTFVLAQAKNPASAIFDDIRILTDV